jgi:hypothetical protein
MILTIADVKAWAAQRLVANRESLERMDQTEATSLLLRGRIDELKKLLVALENQAPPIWDDGSQDA